MRILQVIPGFYYPELFGGSQMVLYQISKALVERGHSVTICTSDLVRMGVRTARVVEDVDGIEIFRFRDLNTVVSKLTRVIVTPGMRQFLSEKLTNYDIIHIHEVRSFQHILVHYYAKKNNIPYILQAHGSLPLTDERQILQKFYDLYWGKKVLQDVSSVIALTPIEAQQYLNLGVPEHKIKIIPNGIDISEYEQLPAKHAFRIKYGLDNERKIILYVGRINKIKGLDLLVQAYSQVIKQLNSDKTSLVIVGPDDEYISTLKRIIKENNLEGKVLLTGPLYNKDKLEAYVDADVFILPSIYETFPVVVLEACACGIPVIVTDRCGISDVINNKAGIVVPCNVKALSKAILDILQNDKVRQEFGINGKLLVKNKFSWTEIVKQIEAIYLECVNNHKPMQTNQE